MTGQGGYIEVPKETLDAISELLGGGEEHDQAVRSAAYEKGRQAALKGDYDSGFTLGHDVGLSAQQESRGFVHGILAGFEAGTQERQKFARELLRPARRPQRQADMEAQAS